MAGVIAAILIASAVSDSLGDVRAWTLIAAVGIGYMISRGLAKSGTKYPAAKTRSNRTTVRAPKVESVLGAPAPAQAGYSHPLEGDPCRKSRTRSKFRFP